MTLREIGSPIDGHPNPVLGFPFFDAATGSLGPGLVGGGGARRARRGIDGVTEAHLLPHRRRRVARGTDLGSDGFLRRSSPWRGGRHLQLQHAGPERLCLVGAGLGASRGEGDSVRRADRNHRRSRSGGDRTRACAIAEDCQRPLAVIARTVKGWGVPSLGGPGHHGTPVKAEATGGRARRARGDGAAPGRHRYRGRRICARLKIAPPAAAPAARAARTPPAGFGAALAKNPALASAKEAFRRAAPMAWRSRRSATPTRRWWRSTPT